MLGITTSDAIALGSMIAALTAACAGLMRGDQARAERKKRRPEADASLEALQELAAAVRDLADVLRAQAAFGNGREQLTDALSELFHRIDRHRG